MKIFFSWQSWSNRKFNWYFMEEAIKEAIDNVKTSLALEYDLEFDRATDGESGAVDIADTILRKIAECDIFVCDVTFISSYTNAESGKIHKVPNPNILFELGYAAKCLEDWNRIILIQNTAYGLPDDLPFDLRKRKVYTYSLDEQNQEKASTRRILSKRIQLAIEEVITKGSRAKKQTDVQLIEEMLGKPDQKIQLENELRRQIEAIYQSVNSKEFFDERGAIIQKYRTNPSELWKAILELYFETCKQTLDVFLSLAWYGTSEQASFVSDAVGKWMEKNDADPESNEAWRYFPSLLLIYTVGLAAVAKNNWTYLFAAFEGERVRHWHYNLSSQFVYPFENIMEETSLTYYYIKKREGEYLPIGNIISSCLESFSTRMFTSKTAFNNTFDLLEFLMALHFTYIQKDNEHRNFFFPRIGYPFTVRSENFILGKLAKWSRRGDNLDVLMNGMFGSSSVNLQDTLKSYQVLLYKEYENISSAFAYGKSNYVDTYK